MPRPNISEAIDERAREAVTDEIQADTASFERVVEALVDQLEASNSYTHRNSVDEEKARQQAIQHVKDAGLIVADDDDDQATSDSMQAPTAFEYDRFPDRDDTPGR